MPRIEFESRKVKGKIHAYLSYPRLAYQSAPLSSAVNARILDFTDHEGKRLRSDLEELEKELQDSDPQERRVTFYAVGCSVAYASSWLLSVGCDTYAFGGGAHGDKGYSVLNLALPSLRKIRLSDIIRTDGASRKRLFEMCNAAQIQSAKNAPKDDDDGVVTLTVPWASVKFDTFTITQKGLVFFFKDQLPFVVADAVTPQVTWEALEPLLKENGRALRADALQPYAAGDAPVEPWDARSEEDK